MHERRSNGQRRWGPGSQLPVRDSNGVIVIADRRQFIDRRLNNTSLADRLVMFSEMPVVGLEGFDDD